MFELDAEQPARELLQYGAGDLDTVFLTHKPPGLGSDAGTGRCGAAGSPESVRSKRRWSPAAPWGPWLPQTPLLRPHPASDTLATGWRRSVRTRPLRSPSG